MHKRTEEMTPDEFFASKTVERKDYSTGFELLKDILGPEFNCEFPEAQSSETKIRILKDRIQGAVDAIGLHLDAMEEEIREGRVKLGFLRTAYAMLPKLEDNNEQ